MRYVLLTAFLLGFGVFSYHLSSQKTERCVRRYGHHPCDARKAHYGELIGLDYVCFELQKSSRSQEGAIHNVFKMRYGTEETVELRDGKLICPNSQPALRAG